MLFSFSICFRVNNLVNILFNRILFLEWCGRIFIIWFITIVCIILILKEAVIIRIEIDFVLEVKGYVLLGKFVYYLGCEVTWWSEFDQLLLFLVEDYHEYILSAQDRKLDRFLQDPSFSFAVRNVPLIFVCNQLNPTKFFFANLILYYN